MTQRRTFHRPAFTIVEVLATLALAAIALPPTVHGILLCMATASYAEQHARAASLAQSKLAELVATGDVSDAEASGDFGEDLPGYAWNAQVEEWEEDSRLSQVDVAVTWTRRDREHEVALTTLVYTGSPRE